MSHRRKSVRPTTKHWKDGPYTFEHSPHSSCEEDSDNRAPVSGAAIEIQSDVYKDFEQLKHATNLDTSALMRNLLKDYHRDPARSSWCQSLMESNEKKPVPDDKQVMAESSMNSSSDVNVNNRVPLPDRDVLDSNSESPLEHCLGSTEQPLDLSRFVKTDSASKIMGKPLENETMAPSRMQVKTVSEANSCDFPAAPTLSSRLETSLVTTNVRLVPIGSQAGLIMATSMPTHCNLVMSSAVPSRDAFATTIEKGDCNIMLPMQMSMHLPTVTAVEGNESLASATESIERQGYPQPGNIFAIIQAVPGSVSAVPVSAIPQPLKPIAASTQPPSALPQHPPTPDLPLNVPVRRGRKPGSMNKRTKVNKQVKSNEMKVISENTMFPGVYTSILKLPWSRRSRTKSHPPAPHTPRQADQSGNVAGNTPAPSSASMPSSAPSTSTTQSVMMVYPNATISALGKPVRKRGRPPKLPVLSHLLSEKKTKRDQHSGQLNQSASVSADGSMLSILNTHSIGADSTSEEDQMKKGQGLLETQDPSSFCPDVAPQTAPPPPLKLEDASGQNTINTNGNGSMFQEMILSSKSLINIKPRKRHSSKFLKSGDNFICTSFRIRPRDSRNKAPVDDPSQSSPVCVAEASVSYPTDNIDPVFPGSRMEKSADRVITSSTTIVSDSNLCKDMFHELYHCKVCNEIVPSEDMLSHKQKHIPVKICLTCGVEYYCHHGNTSNVDAPANFQCERCTESHKNSLSLSVALQEKRKSYQCNLCSQQFNAFSEYCQHRRESHADENTSIDNMSCEECGKMFFCERSLAAHRLTHSTKTVKCVLDDCPVMSLDEEELKDHLKEFHNKDFSWVYDGGKKKFMKRFHPQDNIQAKNVDIQSSYQCSWPGCCKEFEAERHLKVHVLIHEDEKPLKCDFCEYRCRQKNAMNWHMRKHPESPYGYRKFGMLSGCDD